MTKFNVPEMSCGHCTSAIEKEVSIVDPQAKIDCNLEDRTVSIASGLDSTALKNAIQEAGYEASLI